MSTNKRTKFDFPLERIAIYIPPEEENIDIHSYTYQIQGIEGAARSLYDSIILDTPTESLQFAENEIYNFYDDEIVNLSTDEPDEYKPTIPFCYNLAIVIITDPELFGDVKPLLQDSNTSTDDKNKVLSMIFSRAGVQVNSEIMLNNQDKFQYATDLIFGILQEQIQISMPPDKALVSPITETPHHSTDPNIPL